MMAQTWRTIRITAAVAVAACGGLDSTPGAAQQDGPDWAREIQFLLRAVDSIHPAPYRVHSKASWEAAASALIRELPTLRDHEIVVGMARLTGMAADGHTALYTVAARLDAAARAARGLADGEGFDRIYPIRFGVFADGLYVVRARDAASALLGRRIVAINGKPAAEVVSVMVPYVPADHELGAIYHVAGYLRSVAYMHAAGLTDGVDAALTISVVADDGAIAEHAVRPIARESDDEWTRVRTRTGAPAAYPPFRTVSGNYGFEYLQDSRTVYFRYRGVGNSPGESIAEFATRLFAFIDANPVDRLVIDVRGNSGGNGYLNQPIVHGLIRNDKVNQPGKLFVLTDPGVFSAAVMFVADVERHTYALFAGEPPGSPNNHYGDATSVTLPESGLPVRISTLYWQKADARDARMAIIPDIPVQVSFADFVAGRDPVLEAVLDYDAGPSIPNRRPNENWFRPSQRGGWTGVIRW